MLKNKLFLARDPELVKYYKQLSCITTNIHNKTYFDNLKFISFFYTLLTSLKFGTKI